MTFAVVNGVVVGTMYGLFALGIVLVHRGSKVINFAAPALGSFGMYVAWMLVEEQGVNWLAAAIVGVLAGGLAAVLFERLIVRPMQDAPRLSVAVATIGLMLLLISVELFVWTGSPRNMAPPINGVAATLGGVPLTWTKLLSVVVALVLGVLLTQFLRRTDFGLGVQAAAMDPVAVRLVGVRLSAVSSFVWGVGGMLPVIAALLVMPSIGGFAPGSVTQIFFVPAIAAALLGGLDDLGGAFLGGLVVGLVTELSTWAALQADLQFPGSRLVAVFAMIVAVLLVAPRGLVPKLRVALGAVR